MTDTEIANEALGAFQKLHHRMGEFSIDLSSYDDFSGHIAWLRCIDCKTILGYDWVYTHELFGGYDRRTGMCIRNPTCLQVRLSKTP